MERNFRIMIEFEHLGYSAKMTFHSYKEALNYLLNKEITIKNWHVLDVHPTAKDDFMLLELNGDQA